MPSYTIQTQLPKDDVPHWQHVSERPLLDHPYCGMIEETVLVVGSSGFLGRCIVDKLMPRARVFCTYYSQSVFPDSYSYDFFHDDIRPIIEETDVSTVIFTAMVEFEEPEAVAASMQRFVRGCHDRRVVYLSSDGIFDGKRGNYTEDDVPMPCTRYGRNLLTCETFVQDHCANVCIIRPSYLYGFSHGQLDPRLARTRNALMAGEQVQCFHDMYKSPLGVVQVAEAVITLSDSDYVGIMHVAGERLSVFEFHSQAMGALGMATTNLISCPMPETPNFLRDTSLNTSRWQRVTGMKPLTVTKRWRNSKEKNRHDHPPISRG